MKSVAITGYFATGSSAVLNLLQEYRTMDDGGVPAFEHNFLYYMNGVFETADRLLHFNSLFNSNAIINDFRAAMYRLNDNNFGWFGGYKYKYDNQFISIIEDFIDEITDYIIQDAYWYGVLDRQSYSFERIVKDTGKLALGKKFNHGFGKHVVYNKYNRFEFSFADEARIKEATKKLVSRYIEMIFKDDSKCALLNHMLTPQDSKRMNGYLPEDLKLIIVDRDVRDIFIYNKYIWSGVWKHDLSFFPSDAKGFVEFEKRFRNTEEVFDNDRILRIQFEDLIYDYDNTVARIEEFLELDKKDHVYPKMVFKPEESIKNTQLFNSNEEWKEEVKIIEEQLPELTYRFPYLYKSSAEETFDGPTHSVSC